MQIPVHQALHHLTRHPRLVTDVDWSKQMCRHQCKHNWVTLAAHGGCWLRQMFINGHQLMSSMLRIPARRRSDLEGGLKHKFFRNKIDSTSQIDFGQRKRILWSTLKSMSGGDETIWSWRFAIVLIWTVSTISSGKDGINFSNRLYAQIDVDVDVR